jgi:kynurenine formamidase
LADLADDLRAQAALARTDQSRIFLRREQLLLTGARRYSPRLDAPIHFAETGWTSDQIPAENFLGAAIVIDASKQASADADYRLRPEDVLEHERKHGKIPARAIVFMRTGWGSRYSDRKKYFGDDKAGDASNLHFPAFGKEAAALLVHERKAIALAVDTPSIDHGPSKDFPVHQLAARANVLGFENVARLEQLPPTGAVAIALPMKIKDGSGGPLRLIALLPK